MSTKIITQEGTPVSKVSDEHDEEFTPTPEEDIRAIAEDIHRGFRKFKNGVLFKLGVIAVAIKVIDVAGKIILENQRLKAKSQQDDEGS